MEQTSVGETPARIDGACNTMSIRHHPADEVLLDYASGALPEAAFLAVASHLHFCSRCRHDVRSLEEIGGSLLEEITPVSPSDRVLPSLMKRLDQIEPIALKAPHRDVGVLSIPDAIQRYVGNGLSRLNWRHIGAKVEEARLPISTSGVKAALMRLQPGCVMPMHTHRGNEYTLVLAGGYSDAGEQFLPGDFDARDASQKHQPIVDPDGECLCLVVLDAPIKLTSPLGRLANPFLRI